MPMVFAGTVGTALLLAWGSAAGAASDTVDVGTNPTYGTILTDAAGLALYTLDTDHNGMSTCTGSCATAWPALTVPAGTTPTAGAGVTGTVAAVQQSNGTDQVTYNGSPLYTFLSDTAPGQVTGNGVAGFAVVKVAAAPTPTTAPPAAPTTAPPAPATTTPKPVTTPTSTGQSPATGQGATTATTTASSPAAAGAAGQSPTGPSSTGAAVSPAAVPASGSVPAGTSSSLAFTGAGPGLLWIALSGAGLVGLSLPVVVLAGRRRGRRTSHA